MVADPEMMERITYNLLSNAFKFTADNGEIAVRLSAFQKEEKSWVRLEVADTGIGMPEEQLTHIFESFYQVDVHDSGSGIGLALVKAFVEMHHGKYEWTVRSTKVQPLLLICRRNKKGY